MGQLYDGNRELSLIASKEVELATVCATFHKSLLATNIVDSDVLNI